MAESSNALRFLTLWVNERCYALRAEDVAEVMHVPTMTPVPQGPHALLGIANLRGSVLPVASLSRLLAMADASKPSDRRAIVLDLDRPVAIVVDTVEALVTVAPDSVQLKQTELGVAPGERLKGSFQTGTDNHAAKILDIQGLVDAAFTQRARSDRGFRASNASEELEESEAVAEGEMLVTFDVGGQEFALDLAAVQEIFPAPSMRTAVPHAEALVLGMTSLRGTLLPLLSLRGLLGFPPGAAANAREKVVVTHVAGARVGLVADHARAIVSADPALIDPIPPVLAVRMGGESRIRGIYRGDAGRRLITILAPEQLFREDVMQRLSKYRGDEAASAPAAPTRGQELNFLLFRLADGEFALPIDAVEEIAQVPAQITRVPKTPKFLEGVVNLRGSVLPVIDQRRRFDMAKSDQASGRRLVVIHSERHRAGLIVDGVSDVLRIPESAIEAAPNLTDEIARLVRGVINLEQRIVLLLDPSELLTRAERGLLDKFQSEIAQASM